ncbi:abortive infection family protein [Salmonella enterica subsp. enterica serovar Mississippi]|nr:abortive infection family protein [Salmonella enterica subsp. enterica serovar Mississippi]EDX4545172.1 abortive infection family protein [Salmonella enterica subsp. enterica serovar Mississippi]EKE8217617.1 abortive infection family protein [Salmonella enterica]
MLNKVSQVNLAKILADKFNEGDWKELFAVTDCEDVPEGLNQFYRHVHWNNTELKGVAIAAIETTLARDAGNLSKIWALDNVQRYISNADNDLFKEIKDIVNQNGQRNVSATPVKHVNENIYQVLEDAEVLLQKNGPQRAYDRVHTALHASLRQMCVNHGITTDSTNNNVPGLLSLITAHLKALPDDGRNEDVFKMLKSAAAILHGINNLRNNSSMAHPTEKLLNEADARFAINLVRSIMTYIDELL